MTVFVLLVLLQIQSAATSPGQSLPLEQILAKVALNQSSAQQARALYLYTQRLHVRFRKHNGALVREEAREYRIAPAPNGINKSLIDLHGRYARGSEFFAYDKPDFQYKGIDVDGMLANSFADDFTNDKESKDGIGSDLFPLTAKEQAKYIFTMRAKEQYKGRDVYRIAFRPRPHKDGDWAGEAIIDAEDCQPLAVHTKLAYGVPVAVKALLGSNVHGLGFSITYRKVDDVWFPETYGGEFSLRVLFGYRRNISIDMVNSDFVRARVDSTIEFAH